MRNYDNMPHMKWGAKDGLLKAKAQILHGEPLVLEMGAGFSIDMDAGACGCKVVDEGKRYLGCNAQSTLARLADINDQPELARVGEAAEKSGQVVDLDLARARIVIYD